MCRLQVRSHQVELAEHVDECVRLFQIDASFDRVSLKAVRGGDERIRVTVDRADAGCSKPSCGDRDDTGSGTHVEDFASLTTDVL